MQNLRNTNNLYQIKILPRKDCKKLYQFNVRLPRALKMNRTFKNNTLFIAKRLYIEVNIRKIVKSIINVTL